MKTTYLFILFLTVCSLRAQSVKGIVLDKNSNKPLSNVKTHYKKTTIVTDSKGFFKFKIDDIDDFRLKFKKEGYNPTSTSVNFGKGVTFNDKIEEDLGKIYLEIQDEKSVDYNDTSNETILISDIELDEGDDEVEQSSMSILQSSRDAFQNIAAYEFSAARFNQRGYRSNYQDIYFNGMPVNRLSTDSPYWTIWGGLNNVVKNTEESIGLKPLAGVSIGNIGNSTNIKTRASEYRKGTRLSFSLSNRNSYTSRIMATHSTGMSKKGWALTLSASSRLAKANYVKGATYEAYSWFTSLEKKLNEKHTLDLTLIASYNKRGKSSPGTSEVYGDPDFYYLNRGGKDVKIPAIPKVKQDHYYNSYWGWQNGEKRNSRNRTLFEPMAILTHYWKWNNKTKLTTNIGFQTGFVSNTRLERDKSNTPKPDPSYYYYLPSYYVQRQPNSKYIHDIVADRFSNDLKYRQINWDNFYEVNNLRNRDGEGAAYYLADDINQNTTYTASTNLISNVNENIEINAGLHYRYLKSNNFREVGDLLGADRFKDLDSYDKFAQNNLLESSYNANNKHKGDRINYDYDIDKFVLGAYFTNKISLDLVDYYISGEISDTEFYRTGHYLRNENNESSYGRGKTHKFIDFTLKSGLTFKLGKHFIELDGAYLTKAPSLRNSYPLVRNSSKTSTNLQSEKIMSTSLSYILKSSKIKLRATGFFTKFADKTKNSLYFTQGISFANGETAEFLAETLTGLDTKHYGVEFGAKINLTPTLSTTLGAYLGKHIYNSRPNLTYQFSDDSTQDFGSVYIKDFRVPNGPQQAYSLGFRYRSPKYWWAGISGNYFASNYLSIFSAIRTANVYINPDTKAIFPNITNSQKELLYQRKFSEDFDKNFMLNANIGKSWKVGDLYVIASLGINNILDNTDYLSGGFEQSRSGNINELSNNIFFTPKYYYAPGRTFFLNLSVSF